jgi:hypothetical protein
MIQRRDVALMIVTLVLAPPVAGAVFLLSTVIARFGLGGIPAFDAGLFLGTLPFTYLLSLIPTVVVATANALLARLSPSEAKRLLLALPAGAVPFVVGLGWLANDEPARTTDPSTLVAVAFAGAVASLTCVAIVDAFSPAPKTHA